MCAHVGGAVDGKAINEYYYALLAKPIRPTMSVVTVLFLLSYSAWLVHAQSATQCTPVSGQPGCVCDHPDGRIDLTKIANNDGTPRYIVAPSSSLCTESCSERGRWSLVHRG